MTLTETGAVRPNRIDALAVAALTLVLLIPAIANGFPLVFPDSGTYLGIAFGREYAIDRSSFYGFFLKPLVALGPNTVGLWIAVAFQAALVAACLWAAARALGLHGLGGLALVAGIAALTSLPWHAGQFMPDAFTGLVLLTAWLASSRDPADHGAPLLWLAAILAALMHYTHLPLLLLAALAGIGAEMLTGLAVRAAMRRAVAAMLAVAITAAIHLGGNALVLERASVSPMGPLFLFARLQEDGLMAPWLQRHCGKDAPPKLCAIAPTLPRDSQQLLWDFERSPLGKMIFHPVSDAERWAWIDRMDAANRGAIGEAPFKFIDGSLHGAAEQFVHFQAIDDLCPDSCRDVTGGIGYSLQRYRPATVPALHASMQAQGTTPKALVRAITTPVAAIGLILLPWLAWLAWRRRDAPALSLLVALLVGLMVNAALGGALSDVHDRYQSRLIWLAPMIAAMLAMRWRASGPKAIF
jgi:hypothetical protein